MFETMEAHSSKQLIESVEDLHGVSPWPGLLRFSLGLLLLLTLDVLTFSYPVVPQFLFLAILTGIAYASLLFTTHDALHHTLTGWKWFDEVVPRLISYPSLWPHGVYSELHKLHHKMNGRDLRDPERVQPSKGEYEEKGPIGKWLVEHQWLWRIFVLGGFGFIFHHYRDGWRLRKEFPRLKKQLLWDTLGIVFVNTGIYYFANTKQSALLYFCFFIIFERTVGAIQQLRSQIEHYGLWGERANPIETQIFNARNISTWGPTSWYFNRLNYHSVHHAFPRIPFYQLKEAHRRLKLMYPGGLPVERGYLRTAFALARNFQLIP